MTTSTAPTRATCNKATTVQTAVTTNVTQPDKHPKVQQDAQQDVQQDVRPDVHPDVHAPDVAVAASVNRPPKKKARITPPEVEEVEEEDLPNFQEMEEENAVILGRGRPFSVEKWHRAVQCRSQKRSKGARMAG